MLNNKRRKASVSEKSFFLTDDISLVIGQDAGHLGHLSTVYHVAKTAL